MKKKKRKSPYQKNIELVKMYLRGERDNGRICTTHRGAKMCEAECDVMMVRQNLVDKEFGLFMWIIVPKN